MITRTLKTLATMLVAANFVLANPLEPSETIFDHLFRNDVLEFTLETDLAELIENRRTEDYLPAVFTFKDAKGQEHIQEIKVKPRGKFRRRICNFPPLMLNFSKGTLEKEGYIPEFDKLKLVTHCIDDKFESKEQVMKEYLAYQLYREITGLSYRVQLAKVTYIDSKGSLSNIRRYGFVIEDTDEMARRLGGEECEDCRGLSSAELAQRAENQMAVFQYMIGNTDWDLNMIRNVKMVKPRDGGAVIPVPYDFDFAGLVDAPYAIPNSDIGQLTIRQRVFQGRKVSRQLLEDTLRLFLAKKSELMATVDGFRELGRDTRRNIGKYLETFFRDAEEVLNGGQPQDPSLLQAIEESPEEKPSGANSSLGK
ncbi:MAG: hypothetical protein KDD06_08605 [Phaeodactylibacter sp.]|nr:hypothetical protein [Phaeodactylibacter sp.]MCB9288523.1 hypothetical protein [Lewinellaceae bacterium]